MKLRIDPWDPEYGSSIELEPELGPPRGLALDVEVGRQWAPVAAPTGVELPCCAFIDGVRRIDARLFAEDDEEGEAPALAGSWAVGSAFSTRPPRIAEIRIGRELVVGGGLQVEAIEMEIGGQSLRFDARSVAGTTPLDPIQGLQNAMREAEANLAEQTLAAGHADLVVSDGPLTYFATGPAARDDQAPVPVLSRSRTRAGARAAQRRGAHADLQARRAAPGALLVVPAPGRAARRSTARWRGSCASRWLRATASTQPCASPSSRAPLCHGSRLARAEIRVRRRTCFPSAHSRTRFVTALVTPHWSGARSKSRSMRRCCVPDDPRSVGRVLGTEDSTPLEFWVGIEDGAYLQLDDVVMVRTNVPRRPAPARQRRRGHGPRPPRGEPVRYRRVPRRRGATAT